MNSYFVQHPEMILGEMKMESTRFGFDSACKAYKDIPLADLLSKAVQNIQGEIPEYEKGKMCIRDSHYHRCRRDGNQQGTVSWQI